MATGVELSDVQAPVKSSPPTNRHPAFYRLDALPVAQPTASETTSCVILQLQSTMHYFQ